MPDITLEQFEAEAESFLDANATRRKTRRSSSGARAPTRSRCSTSSARKSEREELAKAQAWRQTKFDAGFGWITGPVDVRRPRACRSAYDRAWRRARGQVRRARTRASSASASAWWRRRSSPTPPTRAQGRYLQGDVPRRHRRLPAVQRAGRRQRPAPACRPGPSATATSGSSPARRSGRRARSTATSARSSAAPIPTCPSTRASPASSSTCRRPGVEVRPLRQMTGGRQLQRGVLHRRPRARRPPPRRRQPGLDASRSRR